MDDRRSVIDPVRPTNNETQSLTKLLLLYRFSRLDASTLSTTSLSETILAVESLSQWLVWPPTHTTHY